MAVLVIRVASAGPTLVLRPATSLIAVITGRMTPVLTEAPPPTPAKTAITAALERALTTHVILMGATVTAMGALVAVTKVTAASAARTVDAHSLSHHVKGRATSRMDTIRVAHFGVTAWTGFVK